MSAARFDRDAERAVVGAILSAASYGLEAGWRVFDRAKAVGLEPACFYVRALGTLWAELEQLRAAGIALDPLTASAEIERRAEERVGPLGELLDFDVAGLRARLHELAGEVTAFSSIEAHTAIVVREHERRMQEAA